MESTPQHGIGPDSILSTDTVPAHDRMDRVRLRRRFRWGIAAATVLSVALLGIIIYETDARREVGAIHENRTIRLREIRPYTMFGFDPLVENDVQHTAYFGTRPWPDDLDIVILGGSTAAGDSAGLYELTFFRVAAKLAGRDIVTAAYPGYMSSQEVRILVAQVLPRNPKHVMVLSGANDFILAPGSGFAPGVPFNWTALRGLVDYPEIALLINLEDHNPFWGSTRKYVMRRFAPIPRDEAELESVLEDEFRAEKEQRAERFRIWGDNVSAMARMCTASGMRFTFVAQPNGFTVGALIRDGYWNGARQAYYADVAWPAFLEFAEDVCAREGVHFLDATSVVSGENFMGSAAHFNPSGHAELGQFLTAYLRRTDHPGPPRGTAAFSSAPAAGT